MKKSLIAAAAIGAAFAAAVTGSAPVPLPPPSDKLCEGRIYNFSYNEALAYTKARGIPSESFVVGPEAGQPPETVTTGHTFARATVWWRSRTGVFDNTNKTLCEISSATYYKYKAAQSLPSPAP